MDFKNRTVSLFCCAAVLLGLVACSVPPSSSTASTAPTSTAVSSVSTPSENATVLEVVKGTPNPNGHIEELYLLKGELSEEGTVSLSKDGAALPAAVDTAASSLHVFHFNDMHGNLVKYNAKGDTHSFAQMVKRVGDASAAAGPQEAILFLSAGDDHIGSIFDEMMGSTPEEFVESASYTAYSAGGLDFTLIGNHELDKKSEIFKLALEQNALFPVLSANIVGSEHDLPYYPAAIAVLKGLRVGVIGVTTPSEAALHTAVDPNLGAISPEQALAQIIPALAPHCDALVVMSHNGFDKDGSRYTLEYGDSKIAEQLSTLTDLPTVVVGGHSHTALNADGLDPANVFAGVPVVQTGQHGDNLGEFTMNLSTSPADYTAALHPTRPGNSKDPDILLETEADYDVAFQTSVIDPIKIRLDDILQQTIAKTGSSDLISDEVTVVDRYIGECALANFMNDAMVAKSDSLSSGPVDFAFFNATGMRGLPVNSDITYADMYQLMPYADTLFVVTMTGANIRDIVQSNAMRLYRPEELVPFGGELEATEFLERGIANFSSGIRYTVTNGSTPDQNQVENLTLNGEPIEDVLDKEYKVLLSSYLAIGRGGWNGESIGQGLPEEIIGYDMKTLVAENGTDTGLVYRNELIECIRDAGVIDESTGLVKDERIIVQ